MQKKLAILFLMCLAAGVAACAPATPAATMEPQEGELAYPAGSDAYREEAEATEAPAATEEMAEEPAMEATGAAGGVYELPPVPQAAPPADMFFQDYGTNPFVSAAEDNLSTFAVDVDSASYALTRTYLRDGLLPPPEAVRLEEFVNAFEQDYPIPQDNAFSIYLEAAPTPFTGQESYVLRIGVQGFDVPAEQRPAATLIFVVDVSGSMEEDNRLGAVKYSLHMLLAQLRPTDMIGIVAYGSDAFVVLEPTPVGRAGEIAAAIDSLYTQGSTNAEAGLRVAYEMATGYYDSSRINRLILCSDGVANVGATGPDAILATVRQQANEGIGLSTVGFGMGNYNDVLMEQLANDGDGQYFYVDSADAAARVFVEDLSGTLQVIALDAKIQVEFNPQTVAAYRLMGYENRDVADSDFRNNDVDAGEIGAGHSVTALYEIVPAEQANGALATVHLRWEDPETHDIIEIERSIETSRLLGSFEEASARFRLDVVVAAFADVLGNGSWAQNASLHDIWAVARPISDELGQDPQVLEFLDLLSLAIVLEQ